LPNFEIKTIATIALHPVHKLQNFNTNLYPLTTSTHSERISNHPHFVKEMPTTAPYEPSNQLRLKMHLPVEQHLMNGSPWILLEWRLLQA
jgi:hypothetical protein